MNKKRIFAMIGVVLLLALYASTMVFALIKSPHSAALFRASIYCTIVVPVIIYAGTLIFKNASHRKEWPIDTDDTDQNN